jgi:hypothetical protein
MNYLVMLQSATQQALLPNDTIGGTMCSASKISTTLSLRSNSMNPVHCLRIARRVRIFYKSTNKGSAVGCKFIGANRIFRRTPISSS